MGTNARTAPKAGPLGYGMAPVTVAGGITLMCALGLLAGGYGVVANAFDPASSSPGIHTAPTPGADDDTNEDSETGTGGTGENDGTTGTDDGTGTSTDGPTPPPERESAPEEAQPADTVYYIQWGDTLSQISLDTGVSVERLAEYNAIPNVNLIYANTILRIPCILIPTS